MKNQTDYIENYIKDRNRTQLSFYLGLGLGTLLFFGASKIEPLAEIRERYEPAEVVIYDFNGDNIEDILIKDITGKSYYFESKDYSLPKQIKEEK